MRLLSPWLLLLQDEDTWGATQVRKVVILYLMMRVRLSL